MPRRNIHLLTEDDRRYLNEKYIFGLHDNMLSVKTVNYNRITLHPLDKKIELSTIIRKLTINPDAIKFWYDNVANKRSDITLIDIQNAINILTVSYQDITFENILDVLKVK